MDTITTNKINLNPTITTGTVASSSFTTATTTTSTPISTVTTTPDDYFDYVNSMFYKYFTTPINNIHSSNDFKDIIEHVPNKVYEFIFYDGTKIKTVCSESDTFDLEYAFYLAYAKKIYKNKFTLEGILLQIPFLKTDKQVIKIIKKGMRSFKEKQEKERKAQEEKEIKERQHKKYIVKKKARDQRKRDLKNNDLYRVIKQAIRDTNDE